MPVDIETEVVQLWAASRVVADTMKSKLPREPDGLTIPQSGLRSGRDQQLAGLSQILELTRSFTLELAIKALFRRINRKAIPRIHTTSRSYSIPCPRRQESAKRKMGRRERSQLDSQRADLVRSFGGISPPFEESRYLYERADRVSHFSSLDFDMAILIVMEELTKKNSDKTTMRNILNFVTYERI